MPTLGASELERVCCSVLVAEGTPVRHAEVVAQHLIEANLVGHDSHGIQRLPQYVKQIRDGVIVPAANPEIVTETPSTVEIDGHRCFGQVAARLGAELAIEKARAHDVSCVALRNLAHVGRLGAYTGMAAKAGMAALAFTATGGNVRIVAPHGGREGRMATNPISMSFPCVLEGEILLDFATSAVPEGKVRIARAKGEQVPEGWIIDKDGTPSTDPRAFYDAGALLPFGGHKGYCLGFMTEVLAGILTRDGYAHGAREDFSVGSFDSNGTLIIAINVGRFLDLDTARKQAGELAQYMVETPLAPGFAEIMYPGQAEAKTEKLRRNTGINVDAGTWVQVEALVDYHGLRGELGLNSITERAG